MQLRIRKHMSVGQSVSGFVLLALLSTGMSAIFCPHLAGSSHNCLLHESTHDAHEVRGQPQTSHEHRHLQAKPVMSEETSVDDPSGSELITQTDEPCPHCLNHSQVKIGYTFRGLVNTGPSYEVSTTGTSINPVSDLPSAVTLMDLHGHSPPVANAARYILKSTLRI